MKKNLIIVLLIFFSAILILPAGFSQAGIERQWPGF
jgi:hypothetical protein